MKKIEKLLRSILLGKFSAIVFAIISAIDVIVYYSYRVGFVYVDEALLRIFMLVLFIPSIFVSPAFVCYLMRFLYEKGNSYSVSDSNMKKIKRIIAGYNIQVCPQ